MRSIKPAPTDDQLGGEYPKSWDEFIGQDLAKLQLLTAARSAKKRKTRMDHVLIESGSPGVGKTSLGLLAAAEMGGRCKVVSGKIKAGQARILLAQLRDGDVLLIDEVHLMVHGGKRDAEWLLHYLQDGVIVGPRGAEKQPAVTIVACTTDCGVLPETIVDRFNLRPVIVAYTADEGALIAQTMARRIFARPLPVPTLPDCAKVARAASNNPRVMGHVLTQLRDIALVNDAGNYHADTESYDMEQALLWLGLTADGLTNTACRYLLVLLDDFDGEPAGAAAMADRMQEPGGLKYTERLLMDKGLIMKTRSGRCLSADGIRRARELGGYDLADTIVA